VILKEANGIITKQKEQIRKVTEANDFKTKMKDIEAAHLEDKNLALKEFNSYKEAIKAKEQALERDHAKKVQDMKMEVQDIRLKFDTRCQEFKKQVEDFKKNNEAIEALKKAHAKELAAHVQESNKKYNDLLKAKMDMEDSMNA
jgi:hypothetical protein